MLVYTNDKIGFINDVKRNEIAEKVLASYVQETGYSTGRREQISWRESLRYIKDIIDVPEIPDGAGIAIEYIIPSSSKRIDFIISGLNEEQKNIAVIVELKQWERADLTDMDGIVKTLVGGGIREVSHPSYQVWSYAALLEDFNSGVQDGDIQLKPCAYLHNYKPDDTIRNDFYAEYTQRAPVFLQNDTEKLTDFIKQYVRYGDKNNIMHLIEDGHVRPSKQLADSLESMIEGNAEFVMIDDQKLVYETALRLAREATDEVKNVLIVQGGPGTGKSVVAINLLVELTKRRQTVRYVTKNSAPRSVYEARLTGRISKSRISNMFTSSGSFTTAQANSIDSLVVDEAHRMNEKSGLFSNKGENQVKEIINAAKFSIFFIDEDQRVTLHDIGTSQEIRYWAVQCGAQVTELKLESQFRCNGSDGYIGWLDNVLGIRQTANTDLNDLDYDFQVIDSPGEMHNKIIHSNKINNKSRMVAGYCWPWRSKKDPSVMDIVIDDYSAQWNLHKHGQAWIIQADSVDQIGCIHTCQGLELDYVGVIVGPDLIVRNGKVITDAAKRASGDRSVSGYRKMLAEHPEQAKATGDMIVKNTYRTLMTRGMKGCYIYSTDPETQEYFKFALQPTSPINYQQASTGSSVME